MPRPKPITIDGVTYASQSAAARAFGVNPVTVSKRVKRGAVGAPQHRTPGRPISIDNGAVLGSIYAAARALQVKPSAIRYAAEHGTRCRGHHLRTLTELDLVLAEIEERNRQPYQFSRP